MVLRGSELDGAIQWYLKHRFETQKNGAPRTTVSDEDISALRVIRDAADSGDREAQLIFGQMHSSRPVPGWTLPNIEINDVIAVKYFRMSAEQNVAAAQHELANMYFHGNGLERNILLCEQWNDRAIENQYLFMTQPPDIKPNIRQLESMQTYLLAERLRRVARNPPLLYDDIHVAFRPLPTDVALTPPTPTARILCVACRAFIPIETRKKFCSGCNIAAYCCRECQKADWKRHKKVCGKEPNSTHPLRKVSKDQHKADISVAHDYLHSVPGLIKFATLLYYIHWNDSPMIIVSTAAGTDGMKPTLTVRPKRRWELYVNKDGSSHLWNLYKDGPRIEEFKIQYNLQHLGPEQAKRLESCLRHVEIRPDEQRKYEADAFGLQIVTEDRAVRFAADAQERGLVHHVRAHTTLPTSVNEMNAFHAFHMRLIGKEFEYPELVERASNAIERLDMLEEFLLENGERLERLERP